MRKPLSLATAAASLLSAMPAGAATVIDFNSVRDPKGGYGRVYGPYHEEGFTLAAARCESGSFGNNCFTSPQSFQSMDPTGASLVTQYQSQAITVSKDDGGTFSLQSIDFSEYFDNLIYAPFTSNVNFTFNYANGSKTSETRSFSNAGRYVPSTLTFNTAPLVSFVFTPIGGVQFDNVVVSATSAVPETSTWAMMIVGIGAIGGAMRRRRNVAATRVRFA